jgi:uncharacterized protein
VSPFLLDIDVLVALAWPNHVHHCNTLAWFTEKGAAGFRTCPITQTGFLRVSSNPAFTPHAVTPTEALGLLERIVVLPGHDFWPDDICLKDAVRARNGLAGHRQIMDMYLLSLASVHSGILATLDRGAAALAAASDQAVELIR